MKATKVGSRGYFFSFDDPYFTTLYVINGKNRIFICDTFLGPVPMREVLKFLEKEGVKDKEIVVFNTHYDYDHIWGNQLFENSVILAHELCVKELKETGEDDLKQFEAHKKGDVKLILPNTDFKEKLVFSDDGVEFYHTPGHTADSSSCYDSVDKVLIVGDNLESPFPYIRILNVKEYANSLREYLSRDAEIIVSGHDEIMNSDRLLRENLEYLENFTSKKIDRKNFTKKHRGIHFSNVKTVGELLKKEGKKAEALEYYREAAEILTEAEHVPQIDELKKSIGDIIEELSG
ncbi:MAG: MBL fold metallo-hydrolase [Candidatus Heimdallarchaeota archaeon]|nr:MBL fold metallo-hydrolase [Candidatus Heimdallarchaeota archaeon]